MSTAAAFKTSPQMQDGKAEKVATKKDCGPPATAFWEGREQNTQSKGHKTTKKN
jgi:hypothetical protein